MNRIDLRHATYDIGDASGGAHLAAAVVVTTDDGMVLRCIPHPTGGILSPAQWRWMVLEESGIRHIGPAINEDPALGPIPERIAAWWEAEKELARRQSPSRYDMSMRAESMVLSDEEVPRQ